MYQAFEFKDLSFEGIFVMAVKTTGIFCRIGCPARMPLRKNVEFFASARDALHAGYRPCKRCQPMTPGRHIPKWVKELTASIDQDPARRWKDQDLRNLGLDSSKVRRFFKTNYGMTFLAYCRARRMGVALNEVKNGKGIFESGLEAGYLSDSGFRDAFQKIIGAAPHSVRNQEVLVATWIETPLGAMLAIASDQKLTLLEFVDRRMLETQIKVLRKRLGALIVAGTNRILKQTRAELDQYFGGKLKNFTVPLEIAGTEFQMSVWDQLLKLPYGQVTSYLEIAKRIGDANAVRAVGKANGDNRIAIIVPCHRVVKADGSLCGYGGGLWRKQRLIELESGQTSLL